MTLTDADIQHKLDYEILVDCYDDYEAASAWQQYLEETLEFPFTATAQLKRRGGTTETKSVTIVGIPDNGNRYLDRDFNVQMEQGGYVVPVAWSALSDIQASDKTQEALAVWAFWVG